MKSALQMGRRSSATPFAKSLASSSRFAVSQALHRNYSSDRPFPSRSEGLPGLDVSKLKVTKTTAPQAIQDPKELVFGSTFTGECSVLLDTAHHFKLTLSGKTTCCK